MLVEAVEQLGLELLFRHARLNDLAELGERLVGDGLGLAHQLDLPRFLRRAEGVDLRLHRHEHGVQRLVVAQIVAVGHVVLFKAELFDRVLADDLVDALDLAAARMRHPDGEALEVLLRSLDIAAIGEVIRALARHDGHTLGHAVLRGVEPVVHACQQQRVHFARFEQTLILFNVFHVGSSFFLLQ